MSICTSLPQIEGFDEETAEELQARAREYLDKKREEQDQERKSLGVTDDVAANRRLDPARCWWRSARERHQDGRGLRRLRQRRTPRR